MVLVKNLKFFVLFIFFKIRQENVLDDILESKKTFLDHKKQKVKKVAESAYSHMGYSMALVKNLKFFHLFIFGKIRQENVFDDIRERKKACLDHEKQKVKKVAESAYFQRG